MWSTTSSVQFWPQLSRVHNLGNSPSLYTSMDACMPMKACSSALLCIIYLGSSFFLSITLVFQKERGQSGSKCPAVSCFHQSHEFNIIQTTLTSLDYHTLNMTVRSDWMEVLRPMAALSCRCLQIHKWNGGNKKQQETQNEITLEWKI